MPFWPKEHGAYGQLAGPLVTALAVSGPTWPGGLAALAVVAGFLAHEPWLVLRGARGSRARREQAAAARLWLAATVGTALAAGLAAAALAPPRARWTFLAPVVPAIVVAAELARGREKSALAEAAVALALPLAAVPVATVSGRGAGPGIAVAVPFALVFVGSTFAVRAVTLAAHGAGGRTVALSRLIALVVLLCGSAGLGWAVATGRLPAATLAAAAPGVLFATAVAWAPPPARRLRAIGWALMTVVVLAVVVLIAAL
ncbi:MAG: YwiC-like family protein [Vicinamibacterales bacterium]